MVYFNCEYNEYKRINDTGMFYYYNIMTSVMILKTFNRHHSRQETVKNNLFSYNNLFGNLSSAILM